MKGTIKSKRDVERLFCEGRRSSSYLLTVLALPSSFQKGRCAYIAGKKLGPAPVRNRCKRVMRAAAQELDCPFKGHDVVFIAHRKTSSIPHERLLSEMKKHLHELKVTDDER